MEMILLAVLGLGALIRLPFLDFPPDDDLGFSSYPAHFRKKGVRLVKDYFICFPMLWIYSLVFSVMGKGIRSVRIFDLAVEMAGAMGLFYFGSSLYSPHAGVAAAACYLFFSNSVTITAFTGAQERYYTLITIFGFLLLQEGVASQNSACLLASGLVLGINVFFKNVLLLEPVMAAVATLLSGMGVEGYAIFAAGYAGVAFLGYIPVILRHAGIREFSRLLFLAYKRALQDNKDRGSLKKLLLNFRKLFAEAAPIWVIPPLYILIFSISPANTEYIVVCAWLAAVFGAFFAQGVFWPYHFIPFLPVLSLWTGVGITRFVTERASLPHDTAFIWWGTLAATSLLAIWNHKKGMMAGSDPRKHVGKFTDHKMEHLMVVPQIAKYIKDRTSPGDYIYQWGYMYHLYTLADRMCPVRGGVSIMPPANEWKLEALRSVVSGMRKNPPKYLVIHLQGINLPALERLTGLTFELEKVFSIGLRVYRLKEDNTAIYTPPPVDMRALAELLLDADALFGKIPHLLQEGKTGAAKEILHQVFEINPVHVGGMFTAGKLAAADAEYDKAKEIFTRLAKWDSPEISREALELLLEVCFRTNDKKGISYAANRLAEGESLSPRLAYHASRAFLQIGEEEKALATMEKQDIRKPTFDEREFAASNEYHAAKMLVTKKRYEEAIPHLKTCLKFEPSHRSAEALLDEAVTFLDPVTADSVLVFCAAPPKRVSHALDAVRKDFPGCRITVAARMDTASIYEKDPRVSGIVRFPFRHFSMLRLLFPTVRRVFSSIRADVAVIPVTVVNRSHASLESMNLLLYSYFAGAKRAYYYRAPLRCRQEASIRDSLKIIARKTYEAFMMPFWFVSDIHAMWKHPARKDIVAFCREPNDLVAHNVKAEWIRENGLYGVEFNSYMGNPYTLYYPPLSLWLLGKLGSAGFLILQMTVFGGAAAGAAIVADHPLMILLVPYLLSSLCFRFNAIIVGRLDFLSWGAVLASMVALHSGHTVVAAFFYSAAIFGHTTVAALGGGALFLVAAANGQIFPDFAMLTILTTILTVQWWRPFLRNRKKFGFHKIWSGISFWSRVHIGYRKLVKHLAVFLIAVTVLGGATREMLPLLIPWFIALVGFARGKYIFHGVNLIGAVLTFGAFAAMSAPSAAFIVPFMLMMNFGDPLDNPRLLPLFAGPFVDEVKDFFSHIGRNERLALECQEEHYWDDNLSWGWLFNIAANRYGFQLMSGVGFDQVDPTLTLECEVKMNKASTPEEIRKLMVTTGCSYVAAYTKRFSRMLDAMGFSKIAEKKFASQGFLRERVWSIYKAPFGVSVVDPPVETVYGKNGLVFRPNGARSYRVKLAFYPGWEAVQNGRLLPLKDLSPGMLVNVDGNDEVRLMFKPRIF